MGWQYAIWEKTTFAFKQVQFSSFNITDLEVSGPMVGYSKCTNLHWNEQHVQHKPNWVIEHRSNVVRTNDIFIINSKWHNSVLCQSNIIFFEYHSHKHLHFVIQAKYCSRGRSISSPPPKIQQTFLCRNANEPLKTMWFQSPVWMTSDARMKFDKQCKRWMQFNWNETLTEWMKDQTDAQIRLQWCSYLCVFTLWLSKSFNLGHMHDVYNR